MFSETLMFPGFDADTNSIYENAYENKPLKCFPRFPILNPENRNAKADLKPAKEKYLC